MLSRFTIRFTIFIWFIPSSTISDPQLLARTQTSFIIWNVGQGLWTTLKSEEECQHFDSGGERAPWPKIIETCGRGFTRSNRFHFSHWDYDHVSFARLARYRLQESCLFIGPATAPPNPKRGSILSEFKPCPLSLEQPQPVKEIGFALRPMKRKTSNDLSRIFALDDILLPGDSVARAERVWARSLRARPPIKVLVLGHHGSRTSTSIELLRELPYLKQAIASARKAKYGHPHPEIIRRLQERGVAVVSTEDWGTLRLEQL